MSRKTLEDAIQLMKDRIIPIADANRSLKEAVGCILSEDVYANIDHPPFPRSPLDGYALRADDTKGASGKSPVILKVVDECFAGKNAGVKLEDGCAVRIMTGAGIPDGADCVIRQEEVYADKHFLHVNREMKRYENYCHQGEDFKAGRLLARKGSRIDAAMMAVLASAGFTNVQCIPKARTAILSTGDELRKPGSPLSECCIYDSNEYYLYGRLRDFGIKSRCMDHAEDNCADLAAKIRETLENSDLLITTGGVSVGEKDMIPNALRMMGAEIIFQGIQMKPGMPTLMARISGKVILALSGNPFAAAVGFEVLIRHVLNAMYGSDVLETVRATAKLQNDFPKTSPSRRFIRGVFKDGNVTIPSAQGNGQMASMIGCNCLVEIPEGSGPVSKGNVVNIQML